MEMEVTGIWIVCIIIFLLALVFGLIGIFMMIHIKKKTKNCTVKTSAKVVDIVKNYNSNDIDYSNYFLYHPVFDYTVGNSVYKETSNYGSNPCRYKLGQEVSLRCNPDKPTEYIVEGDFNPKLLSIIFIGVGALLFLISIILWFIKI